MFWHVIHGATPESLNESPSEKEGKSRNICIVPLDAICLNESPSEKEGKLCLLGLFGKETPCLNESPSEKEGK